MSPSVEELYPNNAQPQAQRTVTTMTGKILLALAGCALAGCSNMPVTESVPSSNALNKQVSTKEALVIAAPTPQPGPNKLIELDVVERLNKERIGLGLAPLTSDTSLSASAQEWAEHMHSQGYKHSPVERLEGIRSGNNYGAIAENIHNPATQCPTQPCASDMYFPSSGVLHVDWMRSTEHRNAMLEPRFSRVGVGVYCSSAGDLWAVALFASEFEVFVPSLTQTEYSEPLVGTSDGYTCTNNYRDHNPMWVNSPVH